MLLKLIIRYICIFVGIVENNEFVFDDQVLILDIDFDNEFNWNDIVVEQVY